jgi:Mn-dependent DtxR family transcriptional regulator
MPNQKPYSMTQLNNKKHKYVNYKTIRFTPSGKKKGFSTDDVRQIYDKLKSEGFKQSDISINVMGLEHSMTLKRYDSDQFYDMDEYYRDKVFDPEKFDHYDYIDFTIKKLNK